MADEERCGPSQELFLDERPTLPAQAAAAMTGLVVGLAGVASTWLLQRGCEQVSGTSSCGNPGLLLLLALAVALGLLGAALLRTFGARHAGSTSALAVGLLAVVTLLFLVDALFAWWMVVVIPLVAVATYVGSQVLTTAADAVEPSGPR